MECVEVVESLSQKEKNKILSVLKRDESLQRGQEKKIRDLKHEIQMIRTKAVLRAGDDQNKICLRCRQPFGMIFNRGTICSACKTKVCKDCQEFLFNGSWLCKMCYKQRQLKWLTGEWAVSYDENPLRKWASGSDLIRASMQLRPMSTSSIDIDEPSENKPGTPTRKPAQNGVHGAEQGTKPRVDYPREGDQHRLSQLFDVLRTRKPDSEPSPRSHTEIKRVTSRRYSESDSDSSTSSNGDEISARSSPNTALSLTESELDARRNDSPYGGDIPSPRGLGSPESSESSLRLTSPDKSDDSPEKERQGQKPKPSPRASPRASPRSPRPGARQKGQNENSDPDRSPVKLQSEPIDPNKVVRPKARPRSGEKGYSQGQRSSRAITEISEELSENGTSLSPVESDLQLHVSRTRESLDKKQESHMKLSRTSLDSPSKSGSASPSGSMRSLSEQSARRSSDNLSVRSASSDQGRAVNRKSDEFLNVDKVSRSSRQDLNETSVQIRTTRSREAIEILDDTQTSVSPDPDQFNQNETQIADKDRTTSDKPSDKTQTKTSMQITDDESQGFLTAPRSGSPYSFSMESLPSSHPSPTTRRSIGESSLVESSDTDSISRYSHLDINEHSGTESAARDEEEFVVEEISKVRFKTVTKKIAQMNVLAKISKSPNRNLPEKLGPSRESPQTISECSGSQDDSGHVSGGSRGNTPEHRRTESSYSQSSLPSTLSTVTDRSEEEEDIDKVVAMHNQYAGSRGNLLSVIGDSRESIASYYSDAGDIAVSTVPVSGEILFGLNYNYKTGMLEVAIKQCREIAIADTRRHKTDPYVKSYLLPDKTRSGKRKTKVKKHTTNPVFEETLRYSISKSELENRTLWITVWHNDRFGRNSFLGEVTINFDYYKFGDPTPIWYLLQERVDSTPSSMMVYKGDISVRIRYAPSDRNNSNSPQKGKHKKETAGKGRLEVMVKEARNLTAVRSNGFSDPFCKGYLLPERHKSSKQKTCVIKKNCNPVWNHTFVFDDVSPIELRERCLELTVWDYEKLSSNDFLGGVRLNLGTGVSAGKPVDWMDARGEEMSMWQAMLDRPNLWIDGALILRPNMEKRKF